MQALTKLYYQIQTYSSDELLNELTQDQNLKETIPQSFKSQQHLLLQMRIDQSFKTNSQFLVDLSSNIDKRKLRRQSGQECELVVI